MNEINLETLTLLQSKQAHNLLKMNYLVENHLSFARDSTPHPTITTLFCVAQQCPKGCHFHECRFISYNSITYFQGALSWHGLFASKSAGKQLSLASISEATTAGHHQL